MSRRVGPEAEHPTVGHSQVQPELREDGIPCSNQTARISSSRMTSQELAEIHVPQPSHAGPGAEAQPGPMVGTHAGRPWRARVRLWPGGCSWGTRAAVRSWRRSWR